MARWTYEIVASPLHEDEAVAALVDPIVALLEHLGGCASSGCASGGEWEGDDSHPQVTLVATGGSEAAILAAAERRAARQPGCPTVLLAHPKHNSLPAAMEALARLHQLGQPGTIVFINDVEPEGPVVDQIVDAVEDLAAWHVLRSARLGTVGVASEWLVASRHDADTVRRQWGPSLVEVAIPETVKAFHGVPVEIGRRVAERFGGEAVHDSAMPPPDDVVSAARLEPALRSVIDDHQLDAITVRCFDFLGELQTSGCLALAQLNDDGIVAGCEGDIPSAVAMLWLRTLLDQPSWIANPASIDVDRGTIVFAHCTIAPSMVERVELSTHFESGLGVGVHGQLRDGPVTLVRLGGQRLERAWIENGSVVAGGADGDLCRTQATVLLDHPELARQLLERPLGNHVVIVEGHHRERLERWLRWLGPSLRGSSLEGT